MKDSNLLCLTPRRISLAKFARLLLGPAGRLHAFLKKFTSSAKVKKTSPDISASSNFSRFLASSGCLFWIQSRSWNLFHFCTFSIAGCSSKGSWWSICSESFNDDGQLVDETKMMRSRWNEEVEITELLTCCLRISLRAYILHLHGIPGGVFIHDGVRVVGWRREDP